MLSFCESVEPFYLVYCELIFFYVAYEIAFTGESFL